MKWTLATLLASLALSSPPASAEASRSTLACSRQCYYAHEGEQIWQDLEEQQRIGMLRLDLANPVSWKLVERGGAWSLRDARPPLHHEMFPDPGRDPRIGSYSRSPITLRYWWE